MKLTLEEKRARKAEREASVAKMKKAQEETRAIVATGVCPLCGRKLKRNLSLTGWYMCSQSGSEQFRIEPRLPSCSWQGFTE
jgi:DNA repair exonuclease SbcCD ATPase subunit